MSIIIRFGTRSDGPMWHADETRKLEAAIDVLQWRLALDIDPPAHRHHLYSALGELRTVLHGAAGEENPRCLTTGARGVR